MAEKKENNSTIENVKEFLGECCRSESSTNSDGNSNLDHIKPTINFIHVESFETLEQNVDNNIKDRERENWKGKADFFLSALAYAVGLGAVWRFPYLCYKNGGGVFLIPYFIFLVLIGIPLVFLELCVGQFTSSGPLTSWRMTPIFRGIGFSMNIVNCYLLIYYNMILGYAFYFLYYSFAYMNTALPWEKCTSLWSSPNCYDESNSFNITIIKCDNSSYLKCNNGLCYSALTSLNQTATCQSNNLISLGVWKPAFPTQDFWNKIILEKTDSIDTTGHIVWQLVIALLISWIIVFAFVVNGIKVSGKLVYFTSLFPYVVLLILGIRGWMLPGSEVGIKFYLTPDLSRLKDYKVWTDAAVQLFFTLSVAYGGLVALSSYNKFHTNILRDAIFISVSNCLTSIFAGFVIFSYLGYLSHKSGLEIHDVVQAGQGLAYVVYPFAVTTIKGSHIWAILFFIMMLVLGLDTMMASVETLVTSLFDIIPILRKTKLRRVIAIMLICFSLFLCGLIFCTQSGTYWVEIFDTYSGYWAILLVAAFECISITWFYGFDKFKKDISAMLGEEVTNNKFFIIWKILWTVVSPAILVGIVIFSWVDYKNLESDGYIYPYWSNILGNSLTISSLSGLLIWPIYAILDALFINKRPLKKLFVPDSGWRPIKTEHRVLVNLMHNQEKEKDNRDKGKKNEGFDVVEIEKF